MSVVSINALSPVEVVHAVGDAGACKGHMRLDKVFFSGVSAGCLLAFACGTALSTNTAPAWQESAPGLIRTIGALVFPYGLCMILLTGADLCTGSFMVRLFAGVGYARTLLTMHLVYHHRGSSTPLSLAENAITLANHVHWQSCWIIVCCGRDIWLWRNVLRGPIQSRSNSLCDQKASSTQFRYDSFTGNWLQLASLFGMLLGDAGARSGK